MNNKGNKHLLLIALLAAALLVGREAGAESFVVEDIRLQGLQRVSAGTVFNQLPVSVGDVLDEISVRELIRTLFRSGFFNDIRMARDGGVLVVTLEQAVAALLGRSLLKTPDYDDAALGALVQVAEAVGYSGTSALSRMFTQQMGQSPRQWLRTQQTRVGDDPHGQLQHAPPS
mgnify:CR=1 FL=1